MDEFFQEQLSVYPRSVRYECLDHERWLVIIKNEPGFVKEHWKSMLKYECKKVDRFLYPLFTATIPDSWVKHLSVLNREMLYDICRELSERVGISEAYEYYESCQRRFKFVSVK